MEIWNCKSPKLLTAVRPGLVGGGGGGGGCLLVRWSEQLGGGGRGLEQGGWRDSMPGLELGSTHRVIILLERACLHNRI